MAIETATTPGLTINTDQVAHETVDQYCEPNTGEPNTGEPNTGEPITGEAITQTDFANRSRKILRRVPGVRYSAGRRADDMVLGLGLGLGSGSQVWVFDRGSEY